MKGPALLRQHQFDENPSKSDMPQCLRDHQSHRLITQCGHLSPGCLAQISRFQLRERSIDQNKIYECVMETSRNLQFIDVWDGEQARHRERVCAYVAITGQHRRWFCFASVQRCEVAQA